MQDKCRYYVMQNSNGDAMREVKKLLKIYTREELAVRFEVSVRTVERWRDGTTPRRREMRKILELLAGKK